MTIDLPISKSIANRLLILQAIHGDELMPVSVCGVPDDARIVGCCSMPDDVQLLHHALTTLKNGYRVTRNGYREPTDSEASNSPLGRPIAAQAASDNRIDIGNCGTAMRFLTAYCAQLEGQITILDGVERMHHRPIGQLVDALRNIGADIEYLGEEGFPPLRIKGCILDTDKIVTIDNPQSTQFVSALLLIGANVQTNSTSPYITLTRSLIEQYAPTSSPISNSEASDSPLGRPIAAQAASGSSIELERDWSSAAFWYEYVALYGGEITLSGLSRDSLQGDKVVADIFTHLGVHTTYTPEGVRISGNGYRKSVTDSEASYRALPDLQRSDLQGSARPTAKRSAEEILYQDFSACPDLYPAVALTCERLGIELHATGTESLPIKESDRLRAVREHRTDADHRMAMALLIAGYEVDDTTCISKSYPQFLEHFHLLHGPSQ